MLQIVSEGSRCGRSHPRQPLETGVDQATVKAESLHLLSLQHEIKVSGIIELAYPV
jgi:hypothetical protein